MPVVLILIQNQHKMMESKRAFVVFFSMMILVIHPINAFSQVDIAKLVSPKYDLNVDGKVYELYYGSHGSLEFDVEKLRDEVLLDITSIDVNTEKKSLEIHLDNVLEQQVFWIMIPFEVIQADDNDFILLLDGVETGYEFTKSVNDNTIGMVIPPNTQKIEIIGSNVIPEFGTLSLLVLFSLLIPVLFVKKLGKVITRNSL